MLTFNLPTAAPIRSASGGKILTYRWAAAPDRREQLLHFNDMLSHDHVHVEIWFPMAVCKC